MTPDAEPRRQCGACTMCCKIFEVPVLDKPANVWCQHVAQGRGCSIHATRPQFCRNFHCQWIYNESLGPEWRPDVCRFVLTVYPGSNSLVVTVDPTKRLAWREKPYHQGLRRWAQDAYPAGGQIIVFVGKEATLILPDRDEPLGRLEPGDNVRVSRNAHLFHAEVIRAPKTAPGGLG